MSNDDKDISDFYDTFLVGKKAKSLKKEVLYQLYQKPTKDKKEEAPSVPQTIPPDMINQIDTLYLPDDDGYKYCLTVVDIGTRKTDAEPMKSLDSKTALVTIQIIYKRGIVKIPSQTIQCDSGSEFAGEFKKFFEGNGIQFRISQAGRHRQQGLIESRNKSIGTPLLKRQTAQELLTGEKSTEWVKYLPKVIKYLNEKFSVKKPWNDKAPDYKEIFADVKCKDKSCEVIPNGTLVRFQLDEPIDTQGKKLHGKFRASDIRWSLQPTEIEHPQMMPNQPIMYKIKGKTALYTRNQLQIVSDDSKMPPSKVLEKHKVKKILGKIIKNGKIFYKIWWEGYSKTEATEEPKTELIKDIPDMIKDYEQSLKK